MIIIILGTLLKQDKALQNAYQQPLYNVLEFRANIDCRIFYFSTIHQIKSIEIGRNILKK